jgi:hypothetical protein
MIISKNNLSRLPSKLLHESLSRCNKFVDCSVQSEGKAHYLISLNSNSGLSEEDKLRIDSFISKINEDSENNA